MPDGAGRPRQAGGPDAPGLAAAGDPLVQVRVVDGRAAAEAVTALEPREIPVLGTFAEPWPVGRDQVIGEVAAEVAAALSVQLYGAPGVGKKAIARAVIRRLAAGPNPVHGVELWPAGQPPHTLGSVLERLANLFFAGTTFQSPQARLRVAAAGLAAVVVIGDCELSAGDLAQLLATFPDCTFLLTSEHRTMFSSGVAHEVGPLALDAAVELIARQAGQPAAALARLPAAQAHRLAGGRTQRLLQHAAFLQLTRGQSGPVSPPEQAAALARGLSGPAADVLAVLATFGTELTPDCFAAVTGRPARPARPALPAGPALPSLPGVAKAGAELEAAALVTRVGAAGGGFAYRITPDALAAVRVLAWPPSSAVTAGRGLLQRLNWQDPGQPPPSPALLLAVSGRLHSDGHDDQAARLIRAALPVVLRAGYVADWLRMLRLGLETAGAAGAAGAADLAYFMAEDDTRRRLCGEKPAAGTGAVNAGAVAAEQLTAAGRSAGLPGAAGSAGPAGPPPPRRSGARLLLAGHGIPLILVVVVLALAGALAARSLAAPGTAGPRAAGPSASGPEAAGSGAEGRGAAALGASQDPARSHARPPSGHPRPAPVTASPSPSPLPTTPAGVVQAYFAAINAHDYRKAWQLGGDHLTPSYSQFVAGFADTVSDTVSDTVDVGSAPGEVVGVLLTAVQKDGTTMYYTGTYTVRGGVITGSDIRRTG